MRRRKLLKSIAAGSALSLGMSAGAGAVQLDHEDLDGLQVVRDGTVLERVENPTDEDFRRLDAMAGSDDVLMNFETECITYCKTDCDVACEGEDTCQYQKTCADTKYCCEDGVEEG